MISDHALSSENIAVSTDKKQPKTSIGGDLLPSFSKSSSSRTRTELDTNDFLQHNRQFEMDMKILNVLSPNFKVHLSDYVQEIQLFIKDIVANGRSYGSKLSWNFGQPKTFIECCAISKTLFDTPTVIEQIRELLSTTNNYIHTTSENIHRRLLQNISNFIMHLFDILGLKYDLTFVDDM